METKKRSIAKAISFRIIATFTTMAFLYLVTGNLTLAGTIGIFDIISKLFIYYYHERLWEKLNWGKTQLNKNTDNYSEEL